MVKVIVDARNLKESYKNYEGFYFINGVRYEAAGERTGWQIGQTVAELFGVADDAIVVQELGECCDSGIDGQHVEFTFDKTVGTWLGKTL